MSNTGQVVSVNVSEKTGTIKHPVQRGQIEDGGLVGDAHRGFGHRHLSMLNVERIERFAEEIGRKIAPGEFAENISLAGFDLGGAAVLDSFRIGQAELEVTQIGKECHGQTCAIFREVGKCVMPKEGIFCRVIQGGPICAGDHVEHLSRPLTLRIITVSDRVAAGKYADRSGPRIAQLLREHLSPTRWHEQIEAVVLPDELEQLTAELTRARDDSADVVFTTGGTGIGPRDVTPEAVMAVCDKTIPGVMESIRLKSAPEKPSALLSRSIAAIAHTTQIYALPGSVHAVEEYVHEILKTMEHALFMIHGLDIH